MKLPRWMVVGAVLLCLFLVLGMGAWWLTAPYQTARLFVTLVSGGKFEDANRLLVDCRWEADSSGYILLSSGNRKVSLTAKDWQESFKDAQVGLVARSLSDLLAGRHPLLSKTRFGDLAFTASVDTVSYDGLIQTGKSGWGLAAGTPNNGPPAVTSSYSCTDVDGGSVIMELDDEQIAVVPAYFGAGEFTFAFDANDGPGIKSRWTIKLIDFSSSPRKQLHGTLVLSRNP